MHIFRMTHIQNIPHILQHGITHRVSTNANASYVPIGDSSLISSRSTFSEPINNRFLGDYIPFYFGVRMPMLYMIQNGYYGVTQLLPQDIVYCVSDVSTIANSNLDFIFTDGHAVDNFTSFYNPSDISNIDTIIETASVYAKYWSNANDTDLKRKKQAELLVLGDIPVSLILGYIVYNQIAKDQLIQLGIAEEIITIMPNYYF